MEITELKNIKWNDFNRTFDDFLGLKEIEEITDVNEPKAVIFVKIDGKIITLGESNFLGGGCDCCKDIDRYEDIVTEYAIIKVIE